MESIKKILCSVRKFVNLPGSEDTGSVQAEISWNSSRYKDDDDENDLGYVSYHLSFADCSRSIDYNIDGSNKKERTNAVHKVNELISALEAFRDALPKAFELEDFIKTEEKKRRDEQEKKLKDELEKQENSGESG